MKDYIFKILPFLKCHNVFTVPVSRQGNLEHGGGTYSADCWGPEHVPVPVCIFTFFVMLKIDPGPQAQHARQVLDSPGPGHSKGGIWFSLGLRTLPNLSEKRNQRFI